MGVRDAIENGGDYSKLERTGSVEKGWIKDC